MSPIKILVVEDSPTMRQFICFALRRLPGVVIAEAADGVEGLKKFNLENFNLVMVDINMPIMDGLKLLSLIRKGPLNSKIPVLVLTTEGAQADRDRALSLGADAYLTKPTPGSVILKTVKRLLGIVE
ncbi:MAG: response regulator [bacterium]|nr:response regulator [bacterium]